MGELCEQLRGPPEPTAPFKLVGPYCSARRCASAAAQSVPRGAQVAQQQPDRLLGINPSSCSPVIGARPPVIATGHQARKHRPGSSSALRRRRPAEFPPYRRGDFRWGDRCPRVELRGASDHLAPTGPRPRAPSLTRERGNSESEQYLEGVPSDSPSVSYDRVAERRRAVALARHYREAEGVVDRPDR